MASAAEELDLTDAELALAIDEPFAKFEDVGGMALHALYVLTPPPAQATSAGYAERVAFVQSLQTAVGEATRTVPGPVPSLRLAMVDVGYMESQVYDRLAHLDIWLVVRDTHVSIFWVLPDVWLIEYVADDVGVKLAGWDDVFQTVRNLRDITSLILRNPTVMEHEAVLYDCSMPNSGCWWEREREIVALQQAVKKRHQKKRDAARQVAEEFKWSAPIHLRPVEQNLGYTYRPVSGSEYNRAETGFHAGRRNLWRHALAQLSGEASAKAFAVARFENSPRPKHVKAVLSRQDIPRRKWVAPLKVVNPREFLVHALYLLPPPPRPETKKYDRIRRAVKLVSQGFFNEIGEDDSRTIGENEVLAAIPSVVVDGMGWDGTVTFQHALEGQWIVHFSMVTEENQSESVVLTWPKVLKTIRQLRRFENSRIRMYRPIAEIHQSAFTLWKSRG